MRKTYFFRTYINRPLLFTQWWIPPIWDREEINLLEKNNRDFFINELFIQENNINSYVIESHKQVTRTKLYTRDPEWNYIIPNFYQENKINFFITNWNNNNNNCYIFSTKEWFNQLLSHANNRILTDRYLVLNNENINLNNILSRFDPINLTWIWFIIDGNPNLKNIKLSWNQSVTESEEAQQALEDWWEIQYIKFLYLVWNNNINITLYNDFRFSFYSELDFESDINLINSIINNFNLMTID